MSLMPAGARSPFRIAAALGLGLAVLCVPAQDRPPTTEQTNPLGVKGLGEIAMVGGSTTFPLK
jgi:hypothetical protein